MRLFQQKTNCTCGAVSYLMIVDAIQGRISEKQAVDECKTTSKGTYLSFVHKALRNRGIDANLVQLNTTLSEYSHWLFLNSKNRAIYLDCTFVDQGKRGRPSKREHAIVASDGYIFDPAQTEPCPIEAYFDTFNKELFIQRAIFIDLK